MKTMSEQALRRRTGTRLMLGFYIAWIVITLAIQFYQGAVIYGYGTGFGDGGYVPPAIAESAGFQPGDNPTPGQVVDALTVKGDDAGWLVEAGRLLASLAVLTGIVIFWHAVMSRIGTF